MGYAKQIRGGGHMNSDVLRYGPASCQQDEQRREHQNPARNPECPSRPHRHSVSGRITANVFSCQDSAKSALHAFTNALRKPLIEVDGLPLLAVRRASISNLAAASYTL